ncbi:MAG: methylthioribulose 1-phosphate dehydratase [Candidatus Thermoplasmatota archaeon]|nr:methylthioribulose 1-phosphate dehydratase [Candidatus Thermoplasmatota archaeon]
MQNLEIIVEGQREAFREISRRLIKIGSEFHSRGWLLGTSGNLSAVVSRSPLLIAITASGIDKGNLTEDGILAIEGSGNIISGTGKPSSETPLHIAAIMARGAGSVIHTHSVWGTIISTRFEKAGGFRIEGYEMLKGLDNVSSHDHTEWIPVLPNSQNMPALSVHIEKLLAEREDLHCFMLAGHGLYVWGNTLDDAKRHAEAIEFLLEVYGRTLMAGGQF